MTLKWDQTAPDCQVALLLTPYVQGSYWCGRTWYQTRPDGTWEKVPRGGRRMIQAVWALRDVVPDTPYWARTRHRMTTAHGALQILNLLIQACEAGIITGPVPAPERRPCLCRGPECRFSLR